jgi:hypothetical protein
MSAESVAQSRNFDFENLCDKSHQGLDSFGEKGEN